jgi:hypothetical protein
MSPLFAVALSTRLLLLPWCCVKFPSFLLNFKQFRCHLFSRRVGRRIAFFADRIEIGHLDPGARFGYPIPGTPFAADRISLG